jgi:hypothetical protein
MDPFDFNWGDYYSGSDYSGFEDWISQSTTAPKVNWWEQDYSTPADTAWQNTGQGNDLPAYSTDYLSNLGGDFAQSYGNSGYDFAGGPTSPMGSDSIFSNLGNKAWNLGGQALSSKWAVPTALGLAGSLFQGSADSDTAAYKKKLLEAQNKGQAQGATDYINALQSGKDEAKSSYLQNTAGQKASLLERIGRSTADTGGANPRKVMEKFNRGANEGYGSFLLKLAQEKTAPLEAFTQQAMGNVDIPTEDWWTGFKRGTGSTLGTITGQMAQTNLLNSLLGKG